MLNVDFLTNLVIGVSIVVGALMIVLVFQIYKAGNKDESNS